MLLGLRCSNCTSGLRPPPPPRKLQGQVPVYKSSYSLLAVLYGNNDLVSFISVFPATSTLPSRERKFTYLCKERRKLGKQEVRKGVKKEVVKGPSKSAHDCLPLAGSMSMDSLVTGSSFITYKITGLQSATSKTLWPVHSTILLSYTNAHHASEGHHKKYPFSMRFLKAKLLPPLLLSHLCRCHFPLTLCFKIFLVSP